MKLSGLFVNLTRILTSLCHVADLEMETHPAGAPTTVAMIRAETKFLSCKRLLCKYDCVF